MLLRALRDRAGPFPAESPDAHASHRLHTNRLKYRLDLTTSSLNEPVEDRGHGRHPAAYCRSVASARGEKLGLFRTLAPSAAAFPAPAPRRFRSVRGQLALFVQPGPAHGARTLARPWPIAAGAGIGFVCRALAHRRRHGRACRPSPLPGSPPANWLCFARLSPSAAASYFKHRTSHFKLLLFIGPSLLPAVLHESCRKNGLRRPPKLP